MSDETDTRAALQAAAVEALASYQQADTDGVMVLVSRQAIEECLPTLRAALADAPAGDGRPYSADEFIARLLDANIDQFAILDALEAWRDGEWAIVTDCLPAAPKEAPQ